MAQDKRHVGRLIKQINDALERKINNGMRPMGVTMQQMHVLMDLSKAPEGMLSFKQLEASLGVAQSTIWGLVSRLEGKGFVECLENPEDARAKLVRLTDEGRTLSRAAMEKAQEHEDWLTSGLTTEEAAQLLNLLERIYATIEASHIS